VRSKDLVDPTLDYLFWLFTDEPAFNKAVARALPDASERLALENERNGAATRRAKVQKEFDALVNAVKAGAHPSLLIAEQDKLKAQLEHEDKKHTALTKQIESLPSPEVVQARSDAIRKQLLQEIENRDWRKMTVDEVKQFLIFLFGENPANSGTGIRITFENGDWRIAFKGNVEFKHDLLNGKGTKPQAGNGFIERVVSTRQT
jgi:hypothetical protein